MQPAYKEIAPRVRGLREACDFTVTQLAEKVGVSSDSVMMYEAGECDIPVSFLKNVADVCGVDLTVLISGGEAHLNNFAIVKGGDGLSVQRRKDYDYWNLAARFSHRKMEPFLVVVPPKEESALAWNEHNGQEFIYILEGRLEVWLNKERHVLESGDSIYFDSRIPHALRGLDGKDARFLDVIS